MKRTLTALAALLFSSSALAANNLPPGVPIQAGAVTANHAVKWATSGVIADAGTSQAPGISTLGILSGNACSFSINTALSPLPNNQLCFGVVPGQYAQISLTPLGGASAVPLQFLINGTVYTFPFTIGGIVGPATSIVNDLACWNNTVGSLLDDCGPVPTINAGTTGALAYYASNSSTISPLAKVNNAVLTTNNTGVASLTSYLTLPNSPSLSTSPTGNPTGGSLLATYSTLVAQGTTANASNREFMVQFGLTSNLGSGVLNSNGDKVVLYTGAVGQSGTGDLWSINNLLTQAAGSGTYNAQAQETDLNNLNADRGGSDGPSGYPTHVAVGISVSGASDSNGYTNTANIAIDSFGGPFSNIPLFAHGLVVAGFYKFNEFAEYAQAPTVFALFGGHALGLDCSQSVLTTGCLQLASELNGGITGVTGSSATAKLFRFDGTNLRIAETNVGGTYFTGSIAVGSGSIGATITDGGGLSVAGAATFASSVQISGSVQMTGLSGGAASKYVCVDSANSLVISVAPC